jgi:hypothetical protein
VDKVCYVLDRLPQELLVQCGHYSERVRRDGLGGLADLLAKHPAELRRHAGPLVERLAERITDPSGGARRCFTSTHNKPITSPFEGSRC